jgi:hypothetical protein
MVNSTPTADGGQGVEYQMDANDWVLEITAASGEELALRFSSPVLRIQAGWQIDIPLR